MPCATRWPTRWMPRDRGPACFRRCSRSIKKIAGDLYRFQNNFHYSVFLVTSEGIIVTDPINADAAKWLKAEIKKRFDKPIRYLILSHDHSDHSAGVATLSTAAHSDFLPKKEAPKPALPAPAADPPGPGTATTTAPLTCAADAVLDADHGCVPAACGRGT